MAHTYVNTGFVPGSSNYTAIDDPMHVSTLAFNAKASTVKVNSATQRMVAATLSMVQPFGVTACDDGCEVGQLNQSIKVQINCKYGDANSITAMRAELNRLLDIWQANNLAYGVVPPITSDLDQP